jgi:hypothetical protein
MTVQTVSIPGYPHSFVVSGETEIIKTPNGKKTFLIAYYGEGVLKGKKVTILKTLIEIQDYLDGKDFIKPSERYQVTTQYTQGGMVGVTKLWTVIDTTIESKVMQVVRDFKVKSNAVKFAVKLNNK